MTELITFPKDLTVKVEADYAEVAAHVEGLKIETQEDYEKSIEYLASIKKRIKRLDETRKGLLQPINEAVKEANNKFKMLSEPYAKLEFALRAVVNDYIRREEKRAQIIADQERKKREDELKRIEAAKKKGEVVEENIAPVKVEQANLSVRTEAGFGSTKKRWTFEVVDIEKVPKQFLIVDSVAVNNEIRGGIREIEGLKIYQKTEISIR